MTAIPRSVDLNALRSEAVSAIARGDDARALELFRAAARVEPRNAMHALRSADCLVRLRREAEALVLYRQVAERYAADGFLARAISVYRIVQQLAPRDVMAASRLLALRRKRDAADELEIVPPTAPPEPSPRNFVPPDVAEMFPVLELSAGASTTEAGPASDIAALEATVRFLLGELLRAQRELDERAGGERRVGSAPGGRTADPARIDTVRARVEPVAAA